MVRKEGLEPSRCYPQVPETCASTSSATFAGRGRIARSRTAVKEGAKGGTRAGHRPPEGGLRALGGATPPGFPPGSAWIWGGKPPNPPLGHQPPQWLRDR